MCCCCELYQVFSRFFLYPVPMRESDGARISRFYEEEKQREFEEQQRKQQTTI